MKQRYPIFALVVLFVLGSLSAFAQRNVSGRVTDTGGNGMPGVNVIVKGSSVGTTTDATGNYTINVGQDANTLVFSFIGYATQEVEIGGRTSIGVSMAEDARQLGEVVVTALGVERDVKALNYSVGEVDGARLTQAREINLGNSLAGRVAGVSITPPASGPAGSTRIIIRGNKTLNGDNQPLIVVDGIPMDNSGFGQAGVWGGRDEGNGLSSISPDDIESVTVLKGASATALYGSRGGNGVINVVTKKGSSRKGIGIDFNSNYVFEKLYDQTDLQTEYGAGGYVNGVATKPETPSQAFGWGRSAWGPKLDGSSVLQFDGVARPYSYAGNKFDQFFETGSTFTNTLSLSGGGEQQSFRFSVTDMDNSTIVPNSGYDRTNVTLSTSGRYADRLSFDAKIMYSNEYAKNRPRLSDSPSNAVQSVWYTPNNVDLMSYYGDPSKPGAIPVGLDPQMYTIYGQGGAPRTPGMEWLPASNNWGQNPWWSTLVEINDDIRDRVIGSGSLKYDIFDWLYVSGRVGMDWFTRRDISLTPQGTGYQLGGARSEGEDRVREINLEWTLGGNKDFGKFGVNAFVGGNRMRRDSERIAANGTGFNVAFFPAINNAATRNFGYGFSEIGINSLFGSMEFNYNDVVYVTATGRNDWFSVLNPEFNSVFYPSVGATWIFSDTFQDMPGWLSFGKLRASWAQVGLATIGAYQTNLTYQINGVHLGRPMAGISGATGNTGSLPNAFLQPALSTELELGLDLRLFQDRLGVDISYYDQQTTDDIVSQTVSVASGFGSTRINIGKITNRGYEVLLNGSPITGKLNWDVSLNFAYNQNEVVSLVQGLNEIVGEEPRTRNVFIKHIIGEPYGTITGRVQQRDPNGAPVYTMEGTAVAENKFIPIGYGVHPWSGGLNNAFSYNNFNLEFLVDFKAGGDIFSGTNLRMTQAGFTKQSVIGREGEDPLHITGVVNVGTAEAPEYQTIDRDLTPNEAQVYWSRLGDQSNGISDYWIYDGSFVKLRQLVFGYNFPRKLLEKTPVNTLSLSFVGRNLWVIHKNIENVDPESAYSSNGGAQGLEYFALPAIRSYGFNLRVGF